MAHEVVFQPMGRRVKADPHKTILEMAHESGFGIEATCGGKGLCGKCRVSPSGETNPPSDQELKLLGPKRLPDERLSCQTKLRKGGTVWVPEASRLQQQEILTTGQQVSLLIDPVFQVKDLEIQLPSLENPHTINKILQDAIGGIAHHRVPLSILKSLPEIVRKQSGQITVVTRLEDEVLHVAPGWGGKCLGLAVDLGTTTVVAYLLDLLTGLPLAVKADMNPQIGFGDDVISRIAYCQANPGGLQELSNRIRKCINNLVIQACQDAGTKPNNIMDCVMVGNTAMHHIFLGLDPTGLAQAPYAPITSEEMQTKAGRLGLEFAEEAWLYWLPVKAGFVGADLVSVALAVKADQVTEPTLIMDLGTNGEMILAVPGAMICCSAAAGPAFEGGHIAYGMRAGPGAIKNVQVDPKTLESQVSVIGEVKPLGFCGSGLLSLVSQLLKVGAILPGGSFNDKMSGQRLRSGPDGFEYVIAFAEQNGLGRDLVLTGKDVAEIQLAKGAIRAGVEIMMQELGVKQLGEVFLAGAFGNYINPEDALSLGLFPKIERDKIRGVGNAAGTGAIMALVNQKDRRHISALAQNLQYMELTTHAEFHNLFVDSMSF